MNVYSWDSLFEALWLRKIAFLVSFFVVFIVTYAILSWLDFLPEPIVAKPHVEAPLNPDLSANVIESTQEENKIGIAESIPVSPVFPDTIVIDSLDRTITVFNPNSRSVADLDAALLYGVVRHPDSASLEQDGTVFILGHSSYLPTVMNKNFKAFNGIQNLKFGDTVRLLALDKEYIYRIDRVYRADAKDLTVPIAGETKRLVLATCNSFGSIDDRYIVEGELIEVKALVASNT